MHCIIVNEWNLFSVVHTRRSDSDKTNDPDDTSGSSLKHFHSDKLFVCTFTEWYFWHPLSSPGLADESLRHKFHLSISLYVCEMLQMLRHLFSSKPWQSFLDNFHYQFFRFSFVHVEIVGTFPICLTCSRKICERVSPVVRISGMIKTFWDARHSWRLCQVFVCCRGNLRDWIRI